MGSPKHESFHSLRTSCVPGKLLKALRLIWVIHKSDWTLRGRA